MTTRPGSLGKSPARAARSVASASAHRAPPLARVWHAARGAWLALRLKQVEAELRALKTRTAENGSDSGPEVSREDMAIYESCCMERAVLHAQIVRCRSLRRGAA